jgi:hypothetical protein
MDIAGMVGEALHEAGFEGYQNTVTMSDGVS